MSWHLYCVLRPPEIPPSEVPPGVAGAAVSLVSLAGLSIAVSRSAPGDFPPDLARVRAHERVVAAFNRSQTVIPLRYGCRLADESQVAGLLRERAPRYKALLQELEGCLEIGLRLLVDEPPEGAPPGSPPQDAAPGSGLAYLRARQDYYDRLEGLSQAQGRLARELAANFSGLFYRVKTEPPSPGFPLLSVFFLVPRSQVGEFQQCFRALRLRRAAKLLLSGPWPPYNFVTDEPENPGGNWLAKSVRSGGQGW